MQKLGSTIVLCTQSPAASEDYIFSFIFFFPARYCQIFPKDGYTHLTPDFCLEKQLIAGTTEKNPYRVPFQEMEFRSTLTFPMSCPIKEPIQVYPVHFWSKARGGNKS